ncbi:hypothetical protein OCA23_23975 [Bacillus cereus]|nr:hypothetical protein [Bacillus cereus]
MINKLKVFGGNVLASLVASYIFLYLPLSSLDGGSVNYKGLEKVIYNNLLFIGWILVFVLITSIRWLIRRWINKLQAPFPIGFYMGNNYDIEEYNEAYGFNWKVYADFKRKGNFTNEITGIHVGQIDGPYCKSDDRKMKESRTYLGRYKYKCPKCGYKKVLLKNSWTLECDIKDEIEAQGRRELRKIDK